MPRRQLHEARRKLRARASFAVRLKTLFARLYILAMTLALAVYGSVEMYGVLSTTTVTVLQWIFLVLFSINFTWISFAFAQATLGLVRGRPPFGGAVLSHDFIEAALLLVVVGLTIAIQASLVRPEYFAEPSLFPTWPVFDAERALTLFLLSMAVVLAPKGFGWFAAMLNIRLCLRFGGPLLLTLSTLFEALLSALYAPILMVAQFHVIWAVLRGHDGGWNPQRRDDGALDWATAFRAHRGHMLFGLVLAVTAWEINQPLFYWLLPITLGLVLAAPLSWISGGRRGRAFAWLGLLRAPEEKRPAPVLASMQSELERLPTGQAGSALRRLAADPALLAWHQAQLQSPKAAAKPAMHDFDAAAVTAAWKAEHAASLDELCHWLEPAEKLALLAHHEGLDHLQRFA